MLEYLITTAAAEERRAAGGSKPCDRQLRLLVHQLPLEQLLQSIGFTVILLAYPTAVYLLHENSAVH